MFSDAEFPARPYPGRVPDCSFAHDEATGHPLLPDDTAPSGWRLADGRGDLSDDLSGDLDDWLAARGAAPLAARIPLLCYGSNRCPAKITWLRETLRLPGPAVLVRADCVGVAAVWAAGFRVVDEQRPATLTAAPGVVERHAVWLAAPDQFAALDVCEGRGTRNHLSVLHHDIHLENGTPLDHVLAYTAATAARRPLLVDGRPVRCAEVPQATAATLTGTPAPTDNLTSTRVPTSRTPN